MINLTERPVTEKKTLHPLTFKTIFKDKIWGGTKIKDVLGKDYGDLPNCGETWELSTMPENTSVIANGSLSGIPLNEAIAQYKELLVGEKCYQAFGNKFPLLIKFIDANDDLSIQVHPNDEIARERHDSFGKTEMWYVLQADDDATLITGFNKDISKKEFQQLLASGKLESVLNKEDVETGDVYFLPAGRVHTIGKGLLIAEIQQASDVTYRIYDFDRKDAHGNQRELHIEESLDCIDYAAHEEYKTLYDKSAKGTTKLASCDYFTTNKVVLDVSVKRDYSSVDSFVVFTVLQGSIALDCKAFKDIFKQGDVVLVPACIDEVVITPAKGGAVFLETYLGE